MKKMKKLLALVLAMMMAFSCMAMPTMAHGHDDEGIMPLVERTVCPRCGGAAEYHVNERTGKTRIICLNYTVCGYDSGWR